MVNTVAMWTIGSGGFVGWVWLAEPSGFVADACKRADVEVVDFFVHPLRRGQGWANQLMSKATRWADKQGATVALWATANYGNGYSKRDALRFDALVKFYEQHDFKSVQAKRVEAAWHIKHRSIMQRKPR